MNDNAKYHLMGFTTADREIFLGDYEETFEACEDAQFVFTEYDVFRLIGKEKCILGTRMYIPPKDSPHVPGEIFWRIPRKIQTTRQRRILDFIYSKLGIK